MRLIIFIFISAICIRSFAQPYEIELNKHWTFSRAGTNKWHPAVVPGTVHTDLLKNKLIPDPFFADNEKKLQWIDSCDWIYKTYFNSDAHILQKDKIVLQIAGLDTYADIYLNGELIFQADNMFRAYTVDIKPFLVPGIAELKICFHSALKIVDSIAKSRLPFTLPDNNRVYARKAQFQFGWDWGPKFISCGIWKPLKIIAGDRKATVGTSKSTEPIAKLIQQKDSIGTSFYFEQNGKPVYIKGANWIPANIFLPQVKKADYITLILNAKNAHMNMLRVWGGGVYEDDYFYDLCDRYGIMVWQDFMFAGGMYPADKAFLSNVKEEVKYQIERLKRHPCIVLWCGNNEIDEAWHNWGWQDQFNLHGADSAKVWGDYKTLFEDSLKAWVNQFDGQRPYISSSPKIGWGHKKSFTEGDSHYWGLWWGLEPWETFETHTGRFVSEYGMQAMPNYNTVKTYVPANDLNYSSPAVQAHQKANDGFKKLNFYLDKYFIDSAKLKKLSLEEYTYLSQCLQYYILKNSIAIHRSNEPQNMGTLLWQLNDCWPVTSWSITDFSREPKAAWYAVREAYRDDVKPVKDSIYPRDLTLQKPTFTFQSIGDSRFTIESNTDVKYVFLELWNGPAKISDNYFDLKAGIKKDLSFSDRYLPADLKKYFKITTLYDILHKP
jgi:beta-mannosidase